MDHAGQFLCDRLLQFALVRSRLVFGHQGLDGLPVEEGEDPDVALRILVADIQPELVELVRRRIACVEPYIAALGLPELRPVGFLDQRAGHSVHLSVLYATNQLHTRGDVAPLVRTSQLQPTAMLAIELHEVVPLHQLVGELRKGHAVALAVETLLHGVFRHHVVHGDMLAHVADEFEESHPLHPVVVIDQHGGIGCGRIEIYQFGELPPDGLLITTQGGLVEQVAFERFARRVADHPRRPSDEDDGPVAAALEMTQDHHSHQMAYMQRIGRRVESEVSRSHSLLEILLRTRHHVVHHAAPFQFFCEIHRSVPFNFDLDRGQRYEKSSAKPNNMRVLPRRSI